MASIIGGDFAQVEAMRLADDRTRQAAMLAALSDYARRRQQQGQFDAQMARGSALAAQELTQRKTEREGTLRLQERQLKMDEDYRKWQMSQPSKTDEKAEAAAGNFALNTLVAGVNEDGTLDTDSDGFKKQHPLVQQTLLAAAAENRKTLKPILDRRLAALNLANQAVRMEQVAGGIEPQVVDGKEVGAKAGGSLWNPFNWFGAAAPDPKVIAQDLKAKAVKLRTENKPLLDEAGLVQDPKTKHFTAQFPDWYKEMVGRQLRMATPPTVGTGTNTPAMAPTSPLAGLTNAPMTGTNRPMLDPQTAMQLLIQTRGDRAAARAEAIRRGYTIPLIPAQASP